MDKRWDEIESIFNKVLEADASRRNAVLEKFCAGDAWLKREVESLLAHHSNARDFIENPAFEDVDPAPRLGVRSSQQPRASLKDALVAHYRVLEEIGVGGMGIVYKAEDIKLRRPLALKFLPERQALDSVAVERFRREARAASALNHPNICTIYEIDQHEGREFIAMEFLDGRTLAAYIAGRAHSSETVQKLGIPIAEALAAAHSKGVIHRDVKPGNVFVTSTGLVKVLDFGVAKLLETGESASGIDTLTETNTITGTLAYMSPEQLRGEDLDARSDIYSLGVVLYEMATGKRPYTSSVHGKLTDEILHRAAPPPSAANRRLPPKLDEIILKCLEKDPENRYQTAKEIAVDLRRMSTPSGEIAVARPRRRTWLWATGIPIALLVAAAVSWYFLPMRPPRLTSARRITEVGSALAYPVATDGSGIYFNFGDLSHSKISQVSLNGGETSEFRDPIADSVVVDISADHSQLLAMSGGNDGQNLLLWALPLPTGSPRRLGDIKADFASARWSRDMKWLIFIRGGELWRATADGRDPGRIASMHGFLYRPAISPDSQRIRFSVEDAKNQTSSIWEVRIDGSNLHQLFRGFHQPAHECCGVWTPDGQYYFFRTTSRNDWSEGFGAGDVYAIPDSTDLVRRSRLEPIQLTFGPLSYSIGGFTPDGKKLILIASDQRPELVRYDPRSKQFVPFLNGIAAQFVVFSHDGKRIAYVKISDRTLWTSGTDGTNRFQLTYPPDRVNLPRWSPDDTRIAFMRSQFGKPWKAAVISSQGGAIEELTAGATTEGDPNWSPDGTRIVVSTGMPGTDSQSDLRIIDTKTRQISPVPGSAGKFSPRWSPDGRYLAALDFADFSTQLYLFDLHTSKWTKWITDPDTVGYPTWTRDSRYVQYRAQNNYKRVRIGDNHPEVLFSLKGLVEYPTEAGVWTEVASDGSSMFTRDASTQDIYTLDLEFP